METTGKNRRERTRPGVESYVPIETFYEGKQAAAGETFRDRFAVLEIGNGLRVVAARGEALPAGALLSTDPDDLTFLTAALAERKRVLIPSGIGVLVLFGDMMVCGLVPALIPIGDPTTLAEVPRLIGRRELMLSPTLQTADRREGKRAYSTQEICRELSGELARCDRVFSGTSPVEFRSHCAEVATLAGCRVDVRALPVDDLTVCETDRRRWTLFLLCLFLSLRGANREGPVFSMREIGRDTLTAGMEYRATDDSRKRDEDRFAVLHHPAFRDIRLEQTEEGYRITATLARHAPSGVLRAISASEQFVFLLRSA